MRASAKLQVVHALEAPAPHVAGRGFRGGFRMARESSETLVALGETPGVIARVLEFSPEHLVLEWPLGSMSPARSVTRASLRVRGFDDLSFDVRPGLSNLRDRRGDVGLDLRAPTPALARAILDRGRSLTRDGIANAPTDHAHTREVLEDPRVHDLLHSFMCNGFAATVRVADYPAGTATLATVDGERLRWRYKGPALAGNVRVEVVGYNSVFVLDVAVVSVQQGSLVTTRPPSLVRVRHRAHRRVEAAANIVVEFRHPLWPQTTIRRRVKELSAGGLSFTTRSDEDLLYPELLSENATLYIGDRKMSFMGEVRSLSERGVGGGEYCGLRVMPNSEADERLWQGVLDEHLYPRTKKGEAYAASTWELYERAGYFNLSGKSKEEFVELRRAFESMSGKLDRAPHLGCQVVWTDGENGVEAALSMLKTYSTAWFGYQMAKVSGDTACGVLGRLVLRDIHLHAYEHAQHDASMQWIIGIPQVKKVWSRMVHHDLPARYLDSGQAAVVRFRAVEIACRAEVAPPSSSLDVGVATEEERDLLLGEIARIRPRAYTEALDFVPERFEMTDLSDDWAVAGLDRQRTVFVAREAGVAVAAAVLESAEEGSHLFRLLDSVRLFPLDPGGDSEAANGALLGAARGWFQSFGKPAFIAYLENDLPLPSSLQPVATDLGLADFVILAAGLLPELLEHVVEVTAPREPSANATV